MEPDNPTDYILCECPLENLTRFTTELSAHYSIALTKEPAICLTMIRAQDSVERQEFYLGEALNTDCEVAINNCMGYGICLGDEPERAYCLAVMDAVIALQDERLSLVNAFLNEQLQIIRRQEETEFSHVMRTKVDFKLMEQA